MLFFKSGVLSSLNRIAVSLVRSVVRREKNCCPESEMLFSVIKIPYAWIRNADQARQEDWVYVPTKVLRSSIKLITQRTETEALRVRGADSDVGEESSRTRELLTKSEIIRVDVARLWTELETLRAECLQVASTHGGDALSSGLISASTHAPVIIEYLRSNIHWQREEFEYSNHSQSVYGKALLDVTLLFLGIDLSSLYQKR
ncbi:hypothetical protein ACLOJK_014678 [Asimina triloba]